MRPHLLAFLLALTPDFPLACEDESGGDPNALDAAVIDASARGDSGPGASDGGDPSDAAADVRAAIGQGILNAVSFRPYGTGTGSVYQSASFTLLQAPSDAGPPPAPTVKCEQVVDGTCRLHACDPIPDAAAPPPPPPPPPVDAGPSPNVGPITVTGFAVDAGAVVLTPGAAGTYTTFSEQTPGWSGGEAVTTSWSGAAEELAGPVGAFSKAMPAPAPIALSAPVFPDGGPLAVSRAGDLVFAWTSPPSQPAEATVLVQLYSYASTNTRSVICSFPAASGTGKIAGAIMQRFAAGSATLQVSSDVSSGTRQGEWNVSVGMAATPSNVDVYPVTIELQ